jgi:hypothetical protein
MLLANSAASTAWFALAGALGGVAISGVVALITAFLTHRWRTAEVATEESRRIKSEMFQQRKQVYASYIANHNLIWYHLNLLNGDVSRNGPRSDPQELSEAIAKSEGLRAEILLLASKPVVDAVNTYDDELAEARRRARRGEGLPHVYSAYRSMLDAMRTEMSGTS